LDKNNVAPSVGAVWTPDKREGWLGALMGPEGNFVIRGGYARNYSRPGLTDFSTPFGNNTGLTLALTNVPTTFMLNRDPNSFAQTGAPGTAPLPIFLAYFNGVNNGSSGDSSRYVGPNWTNANILSFLAARNPNPFAFACLNAAGCTDATRQNGFIGNATFRANAASAGLASNFFMANPD